MGSDEMAATVEERRAYTPRGGLREIAAQGWPACPAPTAWFNAGTTRLRTALANALLATACDDYPVPRSVA